MTDTKYDVHPEIVTLIDFKLLVIALPTTDLDDLLTHFITERGKISKSFYDDFLIANCVGNLNQFMAHVQDRAVPSEVNLGELRAEIIAFILKHNPLLAPENIYINKNQVVKLKPKKGKFNGIPLIDNVSWHKSYYDDKGYYKPEREITKCDHCKPQISEDEDEEQKSVDALKWEETQVWWARINEYIIIKKFSIADADHILKQRYFHNRTSFNTYIVSNCVLNVEEIYDRIEGMGVNVDPNKIIRELFILCEGVNEGMNYEHAKELQQDLDGDEEGFSDDNLPAVPKRAQAGVGFAKKNKKNKKTFRDVSKQELLMLSHNMKASLIGQNEAVDLLTESIKRASVGLKDPHKPIGSFLFTGKTGIGKTTASKVLANELIKDKNNIVMIDCSEFTSDHEYSKLIGCFIPGTKVLMGDGGRKNIQDISIGELVITHKGRGRKVEFVHEYDQNGDMVKITTVNSNISETMTKTHEILAIKTNKCSRIHRSYVTCKPSCSSIDCSTKQFEDYSLGWVPAKDLVVGDVLVYPRYKPTYEYPDKIDLAQYIKEFKKYKCDDEFIWAQKHVKIPRYITINEDFTRLAGYFVSEGGVDSTSKKTINFTFNSKEKNYIIEVVKLIRRIFGEDVRIKIIDRVEEGNTYRIYVGSRIICKLMSDLFGNHTNTKKVPEWFKDLPDNLLKGFLETAVFGDGCQVIPRRLDYSTVSMTLHSQMELFFRRLGYITSTSLERKSIKQPNCKDRYRLLIGGHQIEQINKDFNFNINLSDLKPTNIQRMSWADENYIYKQIKKVETVSYTGKVYDLAVQEDTSYIIDFGVHNSPNGYIGFENGGRLTNAMTENPFSVIVFDEIEKASHKVHELMLQVLDEGRLTDGKGKTVSFKDAIIIMTSNIGVKEVDDVSKTIGFGDVAVLTEDKKKKALDEALKRKFKPEFLNRIDSIVHFKDLTKQDYLKIIELELYKLNDNLKVNDTVYKNIQLSFDNKIKQFIYKQGVDEKFGARPIKRAIEKYISTELADLLLNVVTENIAQIDVTVRNGKVALYIMEFEEEHVEEVVTQGMGA